MALSWFITAKATSKEVSKEKALKRAKADCGLSTQNYSLN